MTRETWTAVDEYISQQFLNAQDFDFILTESAAAGLPPFNVSPAQAKFLNLMIRITNAKRVLEVGTLGAYSTVWMAKALPADGKLITLEGNREYAAVAQKNINRAGVSDKIEIRTGMAIKSLAAMEQAGEAQFDIMFVDADKPANAEYFKWALKFVRVGGLIIIDNVVREGLVLQPGADQGIDGIRAMNELITAEKRVDATTLQTVGLKGYDGFTLALVTG